MNSKAIDILLVEDSPTDALVLQAALEAVRWVPFTVMHVERLGDALRELGRRRFDVAVLDMGLPDSVGLDGLVRLRAVAEDMPILLLTGVDDEATAIAAVERGAQDYMVKGQVDGYALSRAIRYAIVRKRGEQLQRAKEDAEAASRAKDDFLAALSHELRTPLTPVVATLSLLDARSDLDSVVREHLELIRRNVALEARLIDDLLDVTRIAHGKVELQRRPVRLCDIIRHAIEVVGPDIEARRLHFGVDTREAPFIVDADAARLQQVFWNLLRNAVKFTPHGGCVGVRCRRDVDGHVVVEVSDSGEGIESEALPRIFNAFEQAGRSITRQFGGLGLGLTISKSLVELHGGTIDAHSEGKGKGATFRVRLPLAAAQPQTQATPQASTAAVRPLRILLVEDHGDTAHVMRLLLMRHGHNVQHAGDIATALELAGQNPFDLLISDLGLPDGSGLELMRQLRAGGNTVPGIALSGYGQEQDLQRSRQVGFLSHLVKPITGEQLVRAISAAAAQSESEG